MVVDGSYLNTADQSSHFICGAVSESSLDNCLACRWQHNYQGRINDGADRQHGQNDEPEPQENVDLLVQNVECQQAQGVMFLNAARRSILVERAFGETRKDLYHRIRSVLLVHVWEVDNIGAVRQKGSAQEFVHKNDVHNDIGQIQEFAEEIAERVAVVRTQALQNVVDQAFLATVPFLGWQCEHTTDARRYNINLAVFPVLPDPVGHVE